jgi:hypothetical protein
MTDETAADDGRDDVPRPTGDGPAHATSDREGDGPAHATSDRDRDGRATESEARRGSDREAGDWNPNEPVPPELRTGADDGIDDELRETVADDLADLEDDEPDYPSGDDPVEPQRVDAENAAFVVLGVVAVLALVAVLVLSI